MAPRITCLSVLKVLLRRKSMMREILFVLFKFMCLPYDLSHISSVFFSIYLYIRWNNKDQKIARVFGAL